MERHFGLQGQTNVSHEADFNARLACTHDHCCPKSMWVSVLPTFPRGELLGELFAQSARGNQRLPSGAQSQIQATFMKRVTTRTLCVLTLFLGTVVAGCNRDPHAAMLKYARSGDNYMAKGKIAEAIVE